VGRGSVPSETVLYRFTGDFTGRFQIGSHSEQHPFGYSKSENRWGPLRRDCHEAEKPSRAAPLVLDTRCACSTNTAPTDSIGDGRGAETRMSRNDRGVRRSLKRGELSWWRQGDTTFVRVWSANRVGMSVWSASPCLASLSSGGGVHLCSAFHRGASLSCVEKQSVFRCVAWLNLFLGVLAGFAWRERLSLPCVLPLEQEEFFSLKRTLDARTVRFSSMRLSERDFSVFSGPQHG
jgi:hypothetical protein